MFACAVLLSAARSVPAFAAEPAFELRRHSRVAALVELGCVLPAHVRALEDSAVALPVRRYVAEIPIRDLVRDADRLVDTCVATGALAPSCDQVGFGLHVAAALLRAHDFAATAQCIDRVLAERVAVLALECERRARGPQEANRDLQARAEASCNK